MDKTKIASGSRFWVRPEFAPIPYCPGCQEPVAGEVILEALDEMHLIGETIAVPGVGCSSFLPFLWQMDAVMTAHGRPPDVATAIKRTLKYPLVFTIQGDGDCIAIGAGSLVGAATRGEKITIIMLNNTNYGTTGGQMSPTTVLGQTTTTSPYGRQASAEGYPVHVPEMLATFPGVVYTARGALNTPANFQKTKRYVKTAFQKQRENLGLSFVEIIVACPPNWHLNPVQCLERIEQKLIPEFSLGEFKNVGPVEEKAKEKVSALA